MVGLRGPVSGKQLERLLTGRHAITGQPLLRGSGSAGRTVHPAPAVLPDAAAWLSLDEAARIVGVSRRYLQRLAEDSRLDAAVRGQQPAGSEAQDAPRQDHLRAEQDPATGRWSVTRDELARFAARREPPTVVIGFDLVCAAPKSLSVLWAFGDEELRADVIAALDAGVDAAIGYLERHAAVGTVGGRNRPGLGLAVASYLHELSRADEAHLHYHNIVVNGVAVPLLDDDGRPLLDDAGIARVESRAFDSEVLLRHVKTAGYLGAAAVRNEFSRRRGLAWGPVRNGVAELADFPAGLLEQFSTRGAETHEEFAHLVADGFKADPATLAAAQRRSRSTKRTHADPAVCAVQLDRLAAAGWTPEQVRALAGRRGRELGPVGEDEIAALFDQLTGARGLTERSTTFGPREVVQAVAAWATDRLDSSAIEQIAERFLADPRVVLLDAVPRRRRNRPEPVYTSVHLLEVEDSLMALYRQGRVDRGGAPRAQVDLSLVDQALEIAAAELRRATGEPQAGLSDEQADLVRRLLSCGDLVRPVLGPAGTGKTEAMRAVVHALIAAGHSVIGTANGGRQSEELHERLDVDCHVVSGWLTRLDTAADPADVWPPETVLILDEATQVGTRDAERLLRCAARTGTVVIAVGDPAQLSSVGAGGWFAHLAAVTPDIPALAHVHRQAGHGMAEVRAALHALRSEVPDRTREALERLARDGRVALFDTSDGLLAAAVDDWYAERRRDANAPGRDPTGRRASRMMAERHRDAELLNRAARARLRDDGTLAGPALHVAGRQFQVGDEVITLTQTGHTLVPAGRTRSAYIRTGTVGVVTAVHLDPDRPERQALTVRFPGRGDVRVGWGYLTHSFPDGRDGGLAHAYALTAHKAEGATMTTARAVVPDDTSKAGLYVMLSRARRDLRAYLIRRGDLRADADPLGDENWLPVLSDPTGPLRRLADHLRQSRTERLATDHDPTAHAAHRLRSRWSLAELAELRRQASTQPMSLDASGVDLQTIRRAELAAEAAISAAAVTEPPPQLVATIGPRPACGPGRAVWDQAIAALAIYHARHHPAAPAHQLGPPPVDTDDPATAWRQMRDTARRITDDWAEGLDPGPSRRFTAKAERLPRHRAVVGIHALLANGWQPDVLAAKLSWREQDTVRSGAAVLDHRVRQILDLHGVDAAPFQLPAPRTARDQWHHAARLLRAAEVNHLAAQPTAALAAEHRTLSRRLAQAVRDHAPLRTRLGLVDGALAHQLDHAAARLAREPAGYLTALLGVPPEDAALAAAWHRDALAVEHYRHYLLGLPYGIAAAPAQAPATEQALGPPPTEPADLRRYQQLCARQATLDLGAAI
jgi:hypothetical protein